MPHIPLIEDLTSGSVPPGSNLLVEFDPASQWYNAALTIAAGWLNSGGKLTYLLSSRAPDNIRSQLTRLGIDVQGLEGGIHFGYGMHTLQPSVSNPGKSTEMNH